jgi:hypothetical protein
MMVPLRLDYQRVIHPFPWAGEILFFLSLTLLTMTGVYYLELAGKVVLLETKTGSNKIPGHKNAGQQTAGKIRGNDTALEIKHANEILHQLTLPWGKLFQAIESSSSSKVALLAMEPEAESHVVKITGEAKDISAVLEYIKTVAQQEVFNSVYLQNHQIQERDPEKPVRFSLLASWKDSP